MIFSNEPMDVMDIIQLLLPVVTFAMGYYLTGIEHKRNQKLSILREKFDKLYHPFYVMINELGTETGEGFALNTEDGSVLKQFFDHFTTNAYLASSEGQQLFWETRNLYMQSMADGHALSKDEDQALGESVSALFGHFLQEYVKAANALGYDLGAAEVRSGTTEG